MNRSRFGMARSRVSVLLTMCLLVSLACAGWPGVPSGARSDAASTRENVKPLISPTELRFRVQRFADGLSEALAQPLDVLLAKEPDIAKRKLLLEAKYAYSSNALFIASGPYPAVSLLDMVVFVSLLSDSIETHGSAIVGDAIGPISRVARQQEREVWEFSGVVLTPPQQEQLRGLIESWLAANPDRGYSESVRFGEFASQLEGKKSKKARGLLSQIRGATATADQALEVAERMTYFFQRAPVIWRMHGQLAYLEMMSQPEMQVILADGSSIAASADRLSNTVSELSSLLTGGPSPEQEIFFSNLGAGEKSLVQVMAGARDTMATANELAGTMEALATRFNVGGPSPEDAEPFDLAKYEGAALQLAHTANEFTSMIETLDELLGSELVAEGLPSVAERFPAVAAAAEAEGNRVLRNTVLFVAGSVVASFFVMLAALLVYRVLAARLTSG